jgi:A/G-specific adenine glycosylase
MELIDLMLTEKYHDLFENIPNIQIKNQIFETKHILSHQIIFARFYTMIIDNENSSFQAMKKVKIDELDSVAVSKLTENFLTQLSEEIFRP